MKTDKKIVVAVSGLGHVFAGTVMSLVLKPMGISMAKFKKAKSRTLEGPVVVFGKSDNGFLSWSVYEDVELRTMSGIRGFNGKSGRGFIGFKGR